MSNRLRIDDFVSRLRTAPVEGVGLYEEKLRRNVGNEKVLHDLFLEARAALMFRQYDWRVRLRESPDLELRFEGELLYAEVKHFRRKKQDQRDDEAMTSATEELVPYGDLAKDASEGCQTAWQQLLDVMMRKERQCVADAPNILVVESSSESMELMGRSAVHAYDEACQSGRSLRRLNGIMFVDITGWSSLERQRRVLSNRLTRCAAQREFDSGS